MEADKHCEDCRHMIPGATAHAARCQKQEWRDLVTGKAMAMLCATMRYPGFACGIDGALFEAHEYAAERRDHAREVAREAAE